MTAFSGNNHPLSTSSAASPRLGLLSALWNRGLPAHTQVSTRVLWPLWLLPIALINQILAPHPVWIVIAVTLMVLYGVGLGWVRSQAQGVQIQRTRMGTLLVAGDTLREDFELYNHSPLPVLWAEFLDHSTLPGYNPGRVVGCGGSASYRWNSTVECRRRGVYQLGPHELVLGDPFGLFRLVIRYRSAEVILIYPRVAHLPIVALPHGDASGATRRRRPLVGPLPSATVREYRAADSLRYVHWPLTAHRGELMVKDLEIEPSGNVWIVLDLNAAVHQTIDDISTLEFSVMVAASLAGELLTSGERRAVGLMTVSGHTPFSTMPVAGPLYPVETDVQSETFVAAAATPTMNERAVLLGPQPGQAQLWRILAALAPVQASNLTLAELLRSSRGALGRRGTLVVVTPQAAPLPGQADWTAELLHMASTGLAASVLHVAAPDEDDAPGQNLRSLLARYEIPVQTLHAGTRLRAALTFRRTRKIVRNTPTGGVVTYDVEEEVG